MTPQTRVAITGPDGQLGTELVRAFVSVGATIDELRRPTFDLEDESSAHIIAELAPDIIVNTAAWTDVDACARHPDRALALNGTAVGRLAVASERAGARFVQISTNEVFDGSADRAYREADEPNPINAYGRSKLAGEVLAQSAASSVVVRTAWIFGGQRSFPNKILAAAQRAAAAGDRLRVVADEVGNPTPARGLAERIVAVAMSEAPPGVIHLAGQPPVSRHAWATEILAGFGMDPPDPIALRDFERASTPPPHAVLDTTLSRSLGLPPITWMERIE